MEEGSSQSYRLIPVPSAMKEIPYDPSLEKEDEPEAKKAKVDATPPTEARKVYIGNLPPSVTEKPLVAYFRAFGHVIDCQVIRDKESGISRGFAFLTFLDESEADSALEHENHLLDGKPINVARAQKGPLSASSKKSSKSNILDCVTLPNLQCRVYLGPLEETVTQSDLTAHLGQYGGIRNLSVVKASESHVKCNFGTVDFCDPISVRRCFSSKNFIKGKFAKITLSRLAIELVLSKTVVFFYEAHEQCERKVLEQHFSQFGQVFRASQFVEEDDLRTVKTYGFVDFVREDAVPKALGQKQQLIKSSFFVRVAKFLPQNLLFDLMAMSEKHGNALLKKMEQSVPDEGLWGSQGFKEAQDDSSSSQVRIPAKLVPRLIGERGKTISEICRDSKTKISIPRVQGEEQNVVVTISGTKMNIKTAQYIMQKLLKSSSK